MTAMEITGFVLIALVAAGALGAWIERNYIRSRFRLTPRWWQIPHITGDTHK